MKNHKSFIGLMLMFLVFLDVFGEAKPTEGVTPKSTNSGNQAENPESIEKQLLRKMVGRLTVEDVDRLKAIHDQNPDAFREEMMKRIRERKENLESNYQKTVDLVKKYRQTSDTSEREKIKAELLLLVSSEFEEKMKKNKEKLERNEKQLEYFKKMVSEREKNRDQIIRDRVEELIKGPEIVW